MAEVSKAARALHDDALVIDALIYRCDGDATPLRTGGVDAVNLTVSGFWADYEATCDEIAEWLVRVAVPGSPWRLVLTVADIDAAKREGKVGLIMGWQNMRPIADSLARLAMFHRLGLRVMQLTYNERNFIGDGCLEPDDGGLSRFGRDAIREMNRIGIAVDLSHVGERTCLDACAVSEKPVLLTHANAKVISDMPRNKSDGVIEAVAATGGLVGVSTYGPLCWNGESVQRPTLDDYMRHLEHIVGLVGVERIALGTDFPVLQDPSTVNSILARSLRRYPGAFAAYAEAFGNDVRDRYMPDCQSPAELPAVTEKLLDRGWDEAHIRGLLGENLRRVLAEIWEA